MKNLIQKYRVVLMIVLFAQAVTLFFLFLSQVGKRRSLADAFLALSMSDTMVTFLLYLGYLGEKREKKLRDETREQMQEDPDGFAIPLDDTARARDFRDKR